MIFKVNHAPSLIFETLVLKLLHPAAEELGVRNRVCEHFKTVTVIA